MPDTRSELVSVGKRRARHRAGLAAAEEEIRSLLVQGRAEGLSVSEMCRLSGVSRETAHKVLRRS